MTAARSPSPVVLVAGIPCGGTTLTAELLNTIPDVVALDEPMDHATVVGTRRWRRLDPDTASDRVARNVTTFAKAQRRSLLSSGTALTKHVDGRVTASKLSPRTPDDSIRVNLARRGPVRVDRLLSDSFTLVIKHNTGFAAALPALVRRLPVYVVVRNPLAILASWDARAPFDVAQGHARQAEAIDQPLRSWLANEPDLVERQINLLRWFFLRYACHIPAERIFRYEDIVATSGAALQPIVDRPPQPAGPLENRNLALDPTGLEPLAERLLATVGPHWDFYTKAEVEALLATSSPPVSGC